MRKHLQGGMTLIELFITITILGILVSLAAPSFLEFMADSRLTNITNELNAAFQYGRSEAVKSGRNTTVAASDCGSGADWSTGAFVWVDLDADGTRDADELLRGDPNPPICVDEYLITATGGATTIVMGANGRASTAESFSVCDLTPAEVNGRLLTLSVSGHMSRNADFTGC